MEIGFFHPLRGYWQAISEPSDEILASYPPDTVQVPLKPSGHHEWDGTQWLLTVAPPSDLDDQNAGII
jgi:hypothetical protein